MKVGKAELEVLLAQELGYQPSALHFSAEPVRVKGAAMSLVEMFRNVCGDIDQNRGGYVHPRIMRATEDMLKRLLLAALRSEEHTSELQSLMRTSYAVFCL